MDWLQVLTIIAANFGLFLWCRSESRSDYRALEADMKQFREIWMMETKDFHKSLCEIEAARK